MDSEQVGIPYQGFLRQGYAFCCPHCNHWKAYPAMLGDIHGILCAGSREVPDRYDPKRFVTCGKFTSETEVIQLRCLRMVEE